ncbi:hypothetical protein RMO59_31945, partial [Streptomyces alfalfae]
MTTTLLPALTSEARSVAHRSAVRPPGGACPCGGGAAEAVLADQDDAQVVRHADVVAKAHAPGTGRRDLTVRLAVAARLPELLLPPLREAPTALHGRLITFWPHGVPVDRGDPDAAPWEAAATLLAGRHLSLIHLRRCRRIERCRARRTPLPEQQKNNKKNNNHPTLQHITQRHHT